MRHRELPLYELDAEVAVANGCDVARAEALATAAAEACEAGAFATAHEKIAAAREELRRAIAVNPSLSQTLIELSEAQAMLSDVVLTYRRNFDIVMPPDLRKQIPPPASPKPTPSPLLATYRVASSAANGAARTSPLWQVHCCLPEAFVASS